MSPDRAAFHVEILTPKRDSESIESDLEKFAEKYRRVLAEGDTICITDNPMGLLSFQAVEVIELLGLPVIPDRLLVHLNTFHTKKELDELLRTYRDMGGRQLLVVSGDGSQKLHRLEPEEVGIPAVTVTSVELLRYIAREHPGVFHCGVAFNPYEPQDSELAKMGRKVEAGAEFIITQPIIGRDDRVLALPAFGLPVTLDAWMSKKLHLLSECVGAAIPEDAPYDPVANLRELRTLYPDFGSYLALLGFKAQYAQLAALRG